MNTTGPARVAGQPPRSMATRRPRHAAPAVIVAVNPHADERAGRLGSPMSCRLRQIADRVQPLVVGGLEVT